MSGLIYSSGRSQPLFEVICLFLKHAVTGSENSELGAAVDGVAGFTLFLFGQG